MPLPNRRRVVTLRVEIKPMAVVAVDSSSDGIWPMTSEVHALLDAELDRLSRDVVEKNGYVSGHLDGETDGPRFVPNIPGQQARRQLERLRDVLERCVVVRDGDLAVIGREVVLREGDGTISRYELVVPGRGNAAAGLVSADSPVGAAILGRRVGHLVTVAAPAGSWTATIVEIS